MSEDLLIASRVALLKQGLKTVQGVLGDLDESRRPFMRQLGVAADVELVRLINDVRALGAQFTMATAKVGAKPPDTYREIRTLARKLEDDTDLILARLETLTAELGLPLTRRAISSEELIAGLNGSTLGTQASTLDDELDLVVEAVARAVGLQKDGDEAGATRAFGSAWEALDEATRKSDAVFGEYVDFIGGLALRETGFDRGLCRIADRFVKDWEDNQNWPWSSWTIPARQEAREVTMARILRLGFPEWSLWALPLAAHEFAYVALEGARLAPVVAAHQKVRDVRTLVADIFAAYVAGPAYAAALFILRLSPVSFRTDHQAPDPPSHAPELPADTDLARAYVTLKTLEALDKPDAGSTPTADVRAQLGAYWDAALAQVRPMPQLKAERVAELNDLVKATIRKIGPDFVFPVHRWSDVQGWSDKLRKEREPEIQPDPEDEVRMALNAVWLARLTSDADGFPSLALAGRSLAERIMYPAPSTDADGSGDSGSNKTEGAGGPLR